MKACLLHAVGAIALTFGIAACVPSAEPPPPSPPPPPVVAPTPTPTPTPTPVVQEPRYDNYLNAPQTEGTWKYTSFPFGSQALFNGGDERTSFAVACIAADRRITLMRPIRSESPRAMSIQAETTRRNLTASPNAGGAPAVSVSLASRDPLLDAMAITKGRFAVGTEGERTLYLPAWAEVSRVIEDCR